MICPGALQGSLPVQGSKNSKARLQVGPSETCPDYVGARQHRSSNPTRRPGAHRGVDVVGPARRRVVRRAPPGRQLPHHRGARPPPGQPPPTGSVSWRHLALVSPALPASRICSAAAEMITRPLRCRQASKHSWQSQAPFRRCVGGRRESNPRRPSQTVTGPRFRPAHHDDCGRPQCRGNFIRDGTVR